VKAWQLLQPAPLPEARFSFGERPAPDFDPQGEPARLLLRVRACAVCHTDLHLVEGDLPPRKRPVTPGHQVVATVEQAAAGARHRPGERVGVPWLAETCGVCAFCRRGEENLCDNARFTGWDVDGGYAELMAARDDFVVPIPERFADDEAAPLLCAGIIGYRSLRRAEVQPGDHVGLYGFGASAHLAIQAACAWGCRVSVFTRGREHRALAERLGAAWTGGAEDRPPQPLDRAVIFAPAGGLVPAALAALRKGGVLAINAIHMSPIPALDYGLLYGERTVRSVANATRRDAIEFLELAATAGVTVEREAFALAEAGQALARLKRREVRGAAVLLPAER
jgi:propanol-preferring alcohol dehydrogenase